MALSEMKIVRASGEKSYPVLPAVIVAFEREFGCTLGEMKSMEHMYWLAWKAEFIVEQKVGSIVKQFDDWLEDILDVTEVEDKKRPTGGRSRSSSQQ